MISNMEYYRVFYYTAKLGSLTAAAEALSVSQPAISQSVRQLEHSLNVKLFERTKKGMRLTSEGAVLFSYVEKGYQQFEMGEEKLKQMKNLEMGEIRIGASDMTLQFFLLPYLEKFHEQYPGIRVNVTNAPTPETIRYLKEDKIDFGIVSTPFHEKGMQAVPVMDIQDTFVAGRRFLPYKNKMLDFSVLEELPMICLEGMTSTRTYIESFLDQKNVHLQPEFRLATSDMIVQFALRNLGVGCVVRNFASTYIEEGRLFELRFTDVLPARKICMIYQKKEALSVAAKALFSIIMQDME